MVNQIKMDPIDNINKLISPKKSPPTNSQATAKSADVTVEMGALAGMTVADNATEESARVLEIKHKIESNSYTVDTNALATKLFEHVFSKTIG